MPAVKELSESLATRIPDSPFVFLLPQTLFQLVNLYLLYPALNQNVNNHTKPHKSLSLLVKTPQTGPDKGTINLLPRNENEWLPQAMNTHARQGKVAAATQLFEASA